MTSRIHSHSARLREEGGAAASTLQYHSRPTSSCGRGCGYASKPQCSVCTHPAQPTLGASQLATKLHVRQPRCKQGAPSDQTYPVVSAPPPPSPFVCFCPPFYSSGVPGFDLVPERVRQRGGGDRGLLDRREPGARPVHGRVRM